MSLFIRSCLALALLLTTARNGLAQCDPPCGTFLTKWGSPGSGDGQFSWPAGIAVGIAVDGSGNVYVADTGNNRIQKFTNTGTFLTKWGSFGSGDGQFGTPGGVAVDGSGNVFVVDSLNRRIQKFTSDGTFLTKWGSYGSGFGQFGYAWGVAVDGSGHVFATDWEETCVFGGCFTTPRIQKFTSDGTFLTQWGSYPEFRYPRGVAVDGSGNVYVADNGQGLIQKFTNTGSFILAWGGYANGNGLAVDESSHVFATAWGEWVCPPIGGCYPIPRIQKFTSDGTFLTQWGSQGSGDGQFGIGEQPDPSDLRIDGPGGIAVDGSGHVFVADRYNNRIQKFACR